MTLLDFLRRISPETGCVAMSGRQVAELVAHIDRLEAEVRALKESR